MRRLLSALLVLFAAICFFAFATKKPVQVFDIRAYKAKQLVRCTPDLSAINAWLEEVSIPLMPGSGSYRWKIATNSDSAQLYFDQGINMYYGFHIIEALASFKKAAAFDSAKPMVWWAQALAYGPNINDAGYTASPEALASTKKAMELSRSATPVEKALIDAMAVRYSEDSSQTREILNQAYVDKLKEAYQKFPASADIAALYADALMLQHPWDLWNNDGTPKPWEPQIQSVLEKLLGRAPHHPGANHYYIHVMEASPYAEKATASADRLGSLTPGLSHMVHMPSHIYIRTGELKKGVTVNEKAVAQYNSYLATFPSVVNASFLYQYHNLHMQANCGLLAGRRDYTMTTAKELQAVIDTSFLSAPAPMGSFVQYIYMTPVLSAVRFAQWKELLAMNQPKEQHVYATLLFHFGRGMALAATNDVDGAIKEDHKMLELMKNEDLKIPMKPFSAVFEAATSAHEMLLGSIAMKKNNWQEAIDHFSAASRTEEAMVYDEPRDWLLSPKPYLGALYLKTGKYQQAQETFEKDLKVNNNNVWSLYGLRQALEKQNKKAEADKIAKRLTIARSESDIDFATAFLP